jgi:hypothetical protein
MQKVWKYWLETREDLKTLNLFLKKFFTLKKVLKNIFKIFNSTVKLEKVPVKIVSDFGK